MVTLAVPVVSFVDSRRTVYTSNPKTDDPNTTTSRRDGENATPMEAHVVRYTEYGVAAAKAPCSGTTIAIA